MVDISPACHQDLEMDIAVDRKVAYALSVRNDRPEEDSPKLPLCALTPFKFSKNGANRFDEACTCLI
jgi:hypothetical protein